MADDLQASVPAELQELERLVQQKFDGELFNSVSGLGTAADPIENSIFRPVFNQSNNLFYDTVIRRSRFADRIVSFLPNKMCQKWCKVTTGRDVDSEVAGTLTRILRQTMRKKFRRAFREAQINGAAVILRLVDDGRDAHEPIDWDNVRQFQHSRIMNRWEVYPDLVDYGTDPRDPTYYLVSSTYAIEGNYNLAWRWHKDRVIRFDGTELTEDGYRWSTGWGDSILVGMIDGIKQYMASVAYSTRSLKSFEVLHLATDILEQAITNNENKTKFENRWATIQATMSVLNMVVTSRTNEELSYLARKYSGVAEMIEKARQYLCDVSGMTKVQLFGEHPTGSIGSTGESLTQDQALTIAEKQQNIFEDPLMIELHLLMASRYGPTNGNVYDDVGLEWIPLYEPTDQEKADLRQKDASTIATLVGLKDTLGKPVFLPEEIRSLYENAQYRHLGEIVLNEEAYAETLKEMEAAAAQEGQFEFPSGTEEEPPPSEEPAPITDGIVTFDGDWHHFTWRSPVPIRMDAKNCETGISCGGTCISSKHTCQVEAGEEAKGLLGKLFGEGRGKKAAIASVGALGLALGTYAVGKNPQVRGAGKDTQAFVASLLTNVTESVSGADIDRLPLSKGIRSQLKDTVGAVRARVFQATFSTADSKIRSVTKDFVGLSLPSVDIRLPDELHSISHVGANPIVFSSIPQRKFRGNSQKDRVAYTMSFTVGNSFLADAGQSLSRREATRTLARTRSLFEDQVRDLPNGSIVENTPQKGDLRNRAGIYRRFGFREIEGGGDRQFAIVEGGRLREPNETDLQDITGNLL